MVYYMARGSADGVFPKKERAAVITDVDMIPYQSTPVEEKYKIRVAVFNPEGIFFSGWLEQGQEGGQWDWMPYQKGQAKKTEELEKKLDEKQS